MKNLVFEDALWYNIYSEITARLTICACKAGQTGTMRPSDKFCQQADYKYFVENNAVLRWLT